MHGKAMDVWALGCTFYKMVYGVTPFSGDLRPADLGKSIIHDQYPRLTAESPSRKSLKTTTSLQTAQRF